MKWKSYSKEIASKRSVNSIFVYSSFGLMIENTCFYFSISRFSRLSVNFRQILFRLDSTCSVRYKFPWLSVLINICEKMNTEIPKKVKKKLSTGIRFQTKGIFRTWITYIIESNVNKTCCSELTINKSPR